MKVEIEKMLNKNFGKEPTHNRALDLVLFFVGKIASLPLWIVIGLAIVIKDGRPVFFPQKHLGQFGQIFYVYKFRSMIKDAEDNTGPVLANKTDHRETKVGCLIRRTADG